jgi:hypothetical protein
LETKAVRSREEKRVRQRVCLGFVAGRFFVCLAANFLAAYRPAGTREALPGAMSRIEKRNSKLEDR